MEKGFNYILKIIFYFLIFLCSNSVIAEDENINDVKTFYKLVPVDEFSFHLDDKERIDLLENRLSEVRRDQLNYKIENDLIKDIYKINYERINIFITLILGIIAILGYLGIKDIGVIKREYTEELDNIKIIKDQFEIKTNEFDDKKMKIEDEIKSILKENQLQNEKIKFIELKEKMRSLFKDRMLTPALEFSNAALEINPTDQICLNMKGSILV